MKVIVKDLVCWQRVEQIGVRCLPGTLSYHREMKAITEGMQKEDKNQILKDFIDSNEEGEISHLVLLCFFYSHAVVRHSIYLIQIIDKFDVTNSDLLPFNDSVIHLAL